MAIPPQAERTAVLRLNGRVRLVARGHHVSTQLQMANRFRGCFVYFARTENHERADILFFSEFISTVGRTPLVLEWHSDVHSVSETTYRVNCMVAACPPTLMVNVPWPWISLTMRFSFNRMARARDLCTTLHSSVSFWRSTWK